jgi:hypothetical protein
MNCSALTWPPTRQQQAKVAAVHFAVVVEVVEARTAARPPVGQQEADVGTADGRVVIEVAEAAAR